MLLIHQYPLRWTLWFNTRSWYGNSRMRSIFFEVKLNLSSCSWYSGKQSMGILTLVGEMEDRLLWQCLRFRILTLQRDLLRMMTW
uniref:Uncharacterized protein n=1 Tax=Picea sitchensis TaxID=3332 RepID=A9NXE6_PICSI|nr:unknown [Picea sitchensis]